MIETIKSVFAASPMMAWSIVAVLIAFAVIAAKWEYVKWWWMNTWMSFPVIGKIARYSKDLNRDTRDQSWFKSERALCTEYNKFVRIMDENDFNEKVEYLTLAGDNGRKPIPGLIWPVIVLMVFVEAMGFSYVLGNFTVVGASENTLRLAAIGIAFLISALLVFMTHFAGHEIHKNLVINDARRKWNENGNRGPLGTQTVPLAKPQNTDADQPEYSRRINRIGQSTTSYKVTWATIIVVVLVAIGATVVRGKQLENELIDEVTMQKSAIMAKANDGGDGLDLLGEDFKLPAEDQASDLAAQEKVVDDRISAQRAGGWTTFMVLAVIFVALQALGVYFGMHWGFAGQNSYQAYRAIGGGRFPTYADVMDYYHYVADTAQSKLEDLQQRLMERNANYGTGGDIKAGHKTFRDFMQEHRASRSKDRLDQRQHTQAAAQQTAAPVATDPAVAEAPAPVPAAPVEEAKSLETILDEIDALPGKQEKLAYISKLPASLQDEVKAGLKARRDAQDKAAREAEAAKKLEDEIGDLL
jgi:hypothetical protein